jgi:LacI family transcriptional regulator
MALRKKIRSAGIIPAGSTQRVTMRDIAQIFGVTPPTVSLAMRNSPRVSESLRLKIQARAREMGYRPDPMLAALSHYRRSHIKSPISAELAWINCWPDQKKLRTHKEFNLYWQGAFAEAESCGYRLEVFDFGGTLKPTRLEQILHARNIQGILLPPVPGGPKPDWVDFHWNKFSVVRFGYSVTNPRAHIVTSDQLANGVMACENIQRLGYRRIGLVTGAHSSVRFAAGYLFHHMQSDTARFSPLILHQTNREEDRRALAKWVKIHRPDSIFTDVGQLPDLLAELHLRIPHDVGLAAFSTLDGNVDAGVYQNSEEIGRAAVQLLISLIHHNELGIPKICREVLVEGCWMDGSSLPDKK